MVPKLARFGLTKRSLVLGSEGFLGRPLCDFLQEKGHEILPYDVKRGVYEDARYERLPLDDVDDVYFLAWDVGGAKYLYRDEIQHRQLAWNLPLLLNVMPQLEKSGIPFLFVSSQLAEEVDTVYGVTKRLGEVWTRLVGGVRVRLWNVYGVPEQPGERSHVISDFVDQAVRTGKIQMLTAGEERRQFIHVKDACCALYQAQEGSLSGLYDISSFEWIRVIDVARMVAAHTGATVIRGNTSGTTPSTPMQGKIVGWQPCISLDEGISGLVADFRETLSNRLLAD